MASELPVRSPRSILCRSFKSSHFPLVLLTFFLCVWCWSTAMFLGMGLPWLTVYVRFSALLIWWLPSIPGNLGYYHLCSLRVLNLLVLQPLSKSCTVVNSSSFFFFLSALTCALAIRFLTRGTFGFPLTWFFFLPLSFQLFLGLPAFAPSPRRILYTYLLCGHAEIHILKLQHYGDIRVTEPADNLTRFLSTRLYFYSTFSPWFAASNNTVASKSCRPPILQ